MNIFRMLGDFSHSFAIILLLQYILGKRTCLGISAKSQILLGLVYTTRYLDLYRLYYTREFTYLWIYNTFMKIFFISSSCLILYLILWRFRKTYDKEHDSFRFEILLLLAFGVSLFINHNIDLDPVEFLWAFSIHLESVAILPQLYMIVKKGEIEGIVGLYLFAMGLYRAWYILNWIYRYGAENHYDPIVLGAGIVQTMIYCIFFCYYNITKNSKRFNRTANQIYVIEEGENKDKLLLSGDKGGLFETPQEKCNFPTSVKF